MDKVLVTAKIQGMARNMDIEIPSDMPVKELAALIMAAVQEEGGVAGEPGQVKIMSDPLGKMLQPDETLAEAGVWDGSFLTIVYR